MPKRRFNPRLLAATALVLAALAPVAADKGYERIVAVADIHGAYDELVEILQAAALIDRDRNWAGGTSKLVQTGDYTDRGSGVRDSIELLMKLERQAAEAGGEVHVLLGNHEIMNLIYDDRDVLVNPDIYASFADEGSPGLRKQAFEDWKKWRNLRQMRQQTSKTALEELPPDVARELNTFLNQSEEQWLAFHPPGLIEYRRAFAPDGKYGRWMRSLPIVVKLGDTLFLHGGIGPDFQDLSAHKINELHRRRLEEWAEDRRQLEARGLVLPYFNWEETYLALRHQLDFPDNRRDRELAARVWNNLKGLYDDLFSDGSPLWYRGYSRPTPSYGLDDERLAELLDRTDRVHGVRRTVAGHTPLGNHSILNRLDGRLFLIDTGMLTAVYGGRASALEITAKGVSPVYAQPDLGRATAGSNGGDGRAEGAAAAGRAGREPAVEEEEEEEEVGEEEQVWEVATAPASRVFLGPDGAPLPFQRPADVERFLREARPVSQEPIGQGKTGAVRVLLEHGGTRARAVFHTIDEKGGSPRDPVLLDDGTKMIYFRDSYLGQVAVYELSKLLGMNNVPPAVVRKIDGKRGSLALWIENGTNLFSWRESGKEDPESPYLSLQMHDTRLFDNLIDNTDRNSQNIFWTGNFDVWLIDHTRTLAQSRKLMKPNRVKRISRGLYEGLKRLDPEQVREQLKPYITGFEIKALLKRREQILAILEEKIESLGEDQVIFEYGEGPVVTFSEPID